MNAHISPENERYIQQVVDRGEYKDSTAVLNEALRVLQERERRIARLREQIKEGVNSGPGIPGDVVFAEMEAYASELASRPRAES